MEDHLNRSGFFTTRRRHGVLLCLFTEAGGDSGVFVDSQRVSRYFQMELTLVVVVVVG